MDHRTNKEIPFLFPTDCHLSPFQEAIGFDPYVGYIGIMRDAIEKTELDEDELY